MNAWVRFALPSFLALLMCGCDPSAIAEGIRGSFERSLTVSGPVDLDVSTGSGNIQVRPGTSGVVRVRGRIEARDSWSGKRAEEKVRWLESNPPIEQSGNTIRIGRIEDREYSSNVSISFEVEAPEDSRLKGSTGSGNLEVDGIRGPVHGSTGSGNVMVARVRERLEASTGSGNLEMDDVRGGVDVSTGSGNIRAARISGALKAETGSGDIRVAQAEVTDFEGSAGSGNIEASDIKGSVRASSGSGNVTLGGNIGGPWTVETGSGNISIMLASDAAFDLFARASSGNLAVDQPVTITGQVGKKEIRSKVRGGGPLVTVKNSSGDIRIR